MFGKGKSLCEKRCRRAKLAFMDCETVYYFFCPFFLTVLLQLAALSLKYSIKKNTASKQPL